MLHKEAINKLSICKCTIKMKKIGIITIHKINNYGSVLQAYALQKACETEDRTVEIIDYTFPNPFHHNNSYAEVGQTSPNEPRYIKLLYALSLIRQHKSMAAFVARYQNLSKQCYNHPDELLKNPPLYDAYITGSDQLWNPRHTNGDPSFMLHFARDSAIKISYAASIANKIPDTLKDIYKKLLSRYSHIAVRENSGVQSIKEITSKSVSVVLDPTLLLTYKQWNEIATPKRLVKQKYILCYFLNYSFNAFPYVERLAEEMRKQTGYVLVRVARPPHHLITPHTKFLIGASPEDFLALVRDAEMVLTTSFHGTAFAVNYGKPLFSVVESREAVDSRQVSLLKNLGLDNQILSIDDSLPNVITSKYDFVREQNKLEVLRNESKNYLKVALQNV